MNIPTLRASILAILSGVLLFLALPPHDVWWCAWFALVPLLVAIRGRTMLSAALLGWLTGAVVNLAAFHWLKDLMDEFTELGAAVYGVMLLMALYQGVPYLAWAMFLKSSGPSPDASSMRRGFAFLVTAISLPVMEFFYPIVFPWYLANTQHSQPNVTGVIELAGCGLLSLAIAAVNLGLARLLLPNDKDEGRLWPLRLGVGGKLKLVISLTLTVCACVGFSVVRNKQIQELQNQAETLQVGLVQPNHWVGQVGPVLAIHDYQRLSLELVEESEAAGAPLDLLMWPESAVRMPPRRFEAEFGSSEDEDLAHLPLDLQRVIPGVSRPAQDLALEEAPRWELLAIQRAHQVPILFGSTLQDRSPGVEGPMPGRPPIYNCGVMVDSEGEIVGIAPKVELLLFGETIPGASYFPQIYEILPLASVLMPGPEPTILDYKNSNLGMMVCYEDLLPWFHYQLAQAKPHVLLNLTNDAWFGKTAEAAAHLALSKLRSVEGRVYLVRSTSSGISAVVDATGRVTGEIGQDVRGTLSRPVALLDVETGFERWGDTVVWIGLLLVILQLIFHRRAKNA